MSCSLVLKTTPKQAHQAFGKMPLFHLLAITTSVALHGPPVAFRARPVLMTAEPDKVATTPDTSAAAYPNIEVAAAAEAAKALLDEDAKALLDDEALANVDVAAAAEAAKAMLGDDELAVAAMSDALSMDDNMDYAFSMLGDDDFRLYAALDAPAMQNYKAWRTRGDRLFARAGDILSTGEKVCARDIVNVLARWNTFAEWDTAGVLPEMDECFDGKGEVKDGPALQKAWARWDVEHEGNLWASTIKKDRTTNLPPWNSWQKKFDPHWGVPEKEAFGSQPWAARSPARRAWCIRRNQAQRWWHNTNVPLLPVGDSTEALAYSVGSSLDELSSMEVKPLACDLVFDALSKSQSGIVSKDLIDERRKAYVTADGAFDADAFNSDLNEGRRNVIVSLMIFPGSLNLVGLIAYIKLDGWQMTMDAGGDVMHQMQANVALWGGMLSESFVMWGGACADACWLF